MPGEKLPVGVQSGKGRRYMYSQRRGAGGGASEGRRWQRVGAENGGASICGARREGAPFSS